jgi:quercetin dioxygenase-like cupin family protein
MPRPHVEFLHAQQLPWRPAPFPGAGWAGIEAKILSRDPGNGACSTLLRLPPGLERGAHALAAAQEWMVLDGALRRGATAYGLDDYAWLPPAYPAAGLASERGAVLLAFFDREPAWLEARATNATGATGATHAAPIERIVTHDMPWTSHDIDPSVQFLQLSHKILRHVPATGEKTILLSSGAQTHPRNWREARLAHDCVEEMYLLGGDIIGERGTMYEGAYFWRPPGQWHGPFGSRRGSLSLIRFVDGHPRNRWSEDVRTFVLEPQHAPELPPELCAVAGAPWEPPRF